MRYLTFAETATWCERHNVCLDARIGASGAAARISTSITGCGGRKSIIDCWRKPLATCSCGTEAYDLVSFVQVGILCGWDMHLVPTSSYARAFLSHDEYVEFGADNPALIEEFADLLSKTSTEMPPAAG
jgi:hypothetical protein